MPKVRLLVGEAQKYESSAAIQACNDYLRMGPGRSLAVLHRRYTSRNNKQQSEPPTRAYPTLRSWSSKYNWADRAGNWDADAEKRKTEAYRRAMETGLSLDFERVRELKELAGFLLEQVYEQGPEGNYHNIWVPDVKSVGSGNHMQVVDIERFNSSIISQLRGVLDDLAQETGGRVKKQEITGAEGGALTFRVVYEDEDIE